MSINTKEIETLQKQKNDLLKQVDPLIAKKKKLYSDVDITTPKSSDEKKLDKEIADLFSEINDLVHKIVKLKKSQNEGKHTMKLKSVKEAIAVGKMVKIVDNPYWEAALGKKGPFKRKVKMIAGDNVFFTDGSNSSMKYVKEDTQLTNEADLNWNAVQNAIINFLKVNTKILDKKVQAKDTEGVKGGLKSIISGLTNAQRSLNLESVNEAVSFKDGKYHFYSKNEVAYLTYGGKEISSGDWDVDADAYFMNHSSWKGQKAFDDGKDVIRYFKKNNIITESSKDDILKDLDKAKTDLLKKVEVLIAKKKKLYSNVDITTPMSADEKKLDKDIADLFSQINTLVLQKRDINRKSVNEAKKSTFTKVARISNNGKLDIY